MSVGHSQETACAILGSESLGPAVFPLGTCWHHYLTLSAPGYLLLTTRSFLGSKVVCEWQIL